MTKFLFDGPPDAFATLLLAHGAGAPMDSPSLTALAEALARQGFRVARFEFGYMAARREGLRRPPPRAEKLIPEFRAAIEALETTSPLLIGGKSMGGRVASCWRTSLYTEEGDRGPPASAIPFTRPASRSSSAPAISLSCKRRPSSARARAIPSAAARGAGYGLFDRIELLWLEDGDHDEATQAGDGPLHADHLRRRRGRRAPGPGAWSRREDRHLQHQRHPAAPAEPAEWLRKLSRTWSASRN